MGVMEQERREGEELVRMVRDTMLNKVYEIQCERETQINLASEMMRMTVSPYHNKTSSAMLDMSCLNSAMSDLSVEQQDMEVATNPSYHPHLLERSKVEAQATSSDPYNQDMKRTGPVYITSLASHGVWHNMQQQQLELHQQQQLEIQQQHQQLELQQQQQLEIQHQNQLESQQKCCHNIVLAEQLGGFVFPTKHVDLAPLLSTMQLH